jgi:hypothetical protein
VGGAGFNSPTLSQAANGSLPAECRNLFASLSEYLDGRVEPLYL